MENIDLSQMKTTSKKINYTSFSEKENFQGACYYTVV